MLLSIGEQALRISFLNAYQTCQHSVSEMPHDRTQNISPYFCRNICCIMMIKFLTKVIQAIEVVHLWPLLLTWFNFNPSMDK